MGRRRVAVVGSGVAGLTAAYVLQRDADVTLFEADDRLGGHADTHDVDAGDQVLPVDTGFIVHNRRTYPTLLRLFSELGVATRASEMSMSVRCDGCGLEYAGGRGLRGLVPTARRLREPRYLHLLTEASRFHRRARALLAAPVNGDDIETTLGEFLDAGRFGTYVRAHFVLPLVSAVWSCGPGTALSYPARYLFEFLANHGALSVSGSPTWRTVVGGSRAYVELAAKSLSAVQTSTPIRSVSRGADGVAIRTDNDEVSRFAGVVIATHADQALRLLQEPTAAEVATLGAFTYSTNPTVLHTDARRLPTARGAQASWNYHLARCDTTADRVRVTYDLTRLQGLDTPTRYLVTLNEDGTVDPNTVRDRMQYQHPIFTPSSVAAQAHLPALNDGRVAFAGAYHGWGFHEDGARSGLAAALSLGGSW
jgi:predicted NAD/FAD-binding protein